MQAKIMCPFHFRRMEEETSRVGSSKPTTEYRGWGCVTKLNHEELLINRPGVAGAALQTPLLLIN